MKTDTKVEHTPTPWTYGDSDHNHNAVVMTEGGNIIALCPKHGVGFTKPGEVAPWHNANANAAFIVQAVNSHQALVEALKDALAWTQTDLESIEDITPNELMLTARLDTLNAALHLAKGEAL